MFPCVKVAAACLVAVGSVVPGLTGVASAQTGGAQAGGAQAGGSVHYRYKTVTIKGEARSEIDGINASGAYAVTALNSNYLGIKLFVASRFGKLTFYKLPFKDISTTTAFYESAASIDNAGDVVGIWTDTDGRTHGFERLADGKITGINDPSASDVKNAGTAVEGISASGRVIVGGYYDSNLALHGFLLEGGKFTTYDVPGAAGTEVTLYAHGTFGGYYVSSTGAMFGFYVKRGKLHTVAAPGEAHPASGFGTELVGISADGRLFGDVFPSGKPIYAFSLAGGRYSTIVDPHEVGTTDLDGTAVTSASSTGVTAGGYTYTNGTSTVGGLVTAFIARPVSRC
jgi:YD repeat-containing protein